MKCFISYNFFGNDEKLLEKNLEKVSSLIEKKGDKTFIYGRDVKDDGIKESEIMKIIFPYLKDSDYLLAFIDNERISEGMSMEIGYAKALNKKVILFVKKGINLRLSKTLADKVIFFEDFDDLEKNISGDLLN